MRRFIAILLALIMVMSLGITSIIAEEPSSESEPEAVSPVGGYLLADIAGGNGSSLELVSKIINMGVSFYLILDEDGTGCMSFIGMDIPLNWDADNIILPTSEENNPTIIPYSFNENSLKMSTSAYALSFNKLTDEELADYKENGSGTLGGLLGSMVMSLIGGLDSDFVSDLFFALAMGMESEKEPIPDGEPSEAPATGVVNGMDFTIPGTRQLENSEMPIIVFFIDVTNHTDDVVRGGDAVFDAAQDGSFLEQEFPSEQLPELYNTTYKIAPGRTLRLVAAFGYNPNGGVVGFRIGFYDEDSVLYYYADPQNLIGAPEEPFAYDADPSIPAFVEGLPEADESIWFENVDFFKDSDGDDAIRFYFKLKNNHDEPIGFGYEHTFSAYQDGISMRVIYGIEDVEAEGNLDVEIEPGEEILLARSLKPRTGSPVVFVIYRDTADDSVPVVAKITEVE